MFDCVGGWLVVGKFLWCYLFVLPFFVIDLKGAFFLEGGYLFNFSYFITRLYS